MEGIELTAFEIISSVGAARSCFISAMHSAREKDFIEAEKLIEEGKQHFLMGHHAHSKLIQEDAAGNHPTINLLLIHAEDQLMAAESFKILANEFILINKEIKNLKDIK